MEEEEKNRLENDSSKKNKDQSPIDKIIEKKSIINEIFEETEILTKKQVSNKRKNEPEIATLISGKRIDLSVLASEIQNHPSQFKQELYNEIYRVFRISGDPTEWHKDKRVADFTNEFLYSSRYEETVLPALRAKNKYDPTKYCTRFNKHYQYFTNEGIARLQTYISQTMDVLADCVDEYGFRKAMFEKYKVPLQKDLFRD